MPTYRDFAVSLALGWAASAGGEAWGDDLVFGSAPASVPATQGTTPQKELALEVIRERYPDRSVKIERHATQDANLNYLNHGPWTMWHPGGSVLAKGEYWQGKKHGEWKRFYPPADGPSRDLSERDAVQLRDAFDGAEFKGFTKPYVSSATFVEDKIVGTWSVVDSEGRILFSIELDRNIPQGRASWYFASGNPRRQIDFKQGAVDGEWIEFDETCATVRKDRYIEGRRQSDAVTKYDSGEKSSEGTYLYAKEKVVVDFDWWTGAVQVNIAGTEGKPIKQGKWNYWYEDGGKRCEAEFLDDKPIGHHVWWHRNGQKECEGDYVDGKSQGTWTYWHENGQKAAQGDYLNGTKVGKWIRWSEEGKVVEAKDHPYNDVALQPVPYGQSMQAMAVPQQTFGTLPSQAPSTVPAGPGYPTNVSGTPTAIPGVPQPTTAAPQVIGPQGLPPGFHPYQPGMQPRPVPNASRPRGGIFRLR